MSSRGAPGEPHGVIAARIREALEDSRRASRYPLSRPPEADAQRRGRNWRALSTMEGRADLVGFRLTSRLQGLARASTVVREALRRALFQVLHRQSEFNRATIELVRSHETQLEALGATVRAQLDLMASADERVDALERIVAGLERDSGAPARWSARSGLEDLDRLALTELLRGSAAEIRESQRGFVSRFAGQSAVVDLGCSRGDFLRLLMEAGVPAVGVDSDEAMVSYCRKLGLEAVHDDVLHFLRDRPSESHGGIFAGHLVEQLQREDIVDFVRLAFTRLRPGGVLVLETVNPSSLLTYTDFYGDFTHVAPVPPLALQWLAQSCGFVSVEVEYRSPVPAERKLRLLPASAGGEAEVEAFNHGIAAANELLFGFREYALIARKPDRAR